MIYRYPKKGDEDKFLAFLDTIDSEFFDAEKLNGPRFVTGMMNLVSGNKGVCLFAEDGSKIKGFCNIIRENGAWNLGIGVSKAERRKGIANSLIDDCLSLAKKIGIEKVSANTKKGNIPMQALLIKQGFTKTDENEEKVFFEKKL